LGLARASLRNKSIDVSFDPVGMDWIALEGAKVVSLFDLGQVVPGLNDCFRIDRELHLLFQLAFVVPGLTVINHTLRRVTVTIKGAESSPYTGGFFVVDVTFPLDYAESPPLIKFVTPVFHPSIHPVSGVMACACPTHYYWVPAVKVSAMLELMYECLTHPQVDTGLAYEPALDTEISICSDITAPARVIESDISLFDAVTLLQMNPELFVEVAAEWTQQFANYERAKQVIDADRLGMRLT